MRKTLLATAIGCGFALAVPAFAQAPAATASPTAPSVDKPAAAAANTPAPPAAPAVAPAPPPPPAPAPAPPPPPAAAPETPPPPPPEEKPVKKPMMMMSGKPVSGMASHITAGDSNGDIAPRLPSPKLGPNASPDDYLMAAKQALKMKKTGEAQEALEMAETRMLDRSETVDKAGSPDMGPKVSAVHDALASLAKKDYKGADASIGAAMSGKPVEQGTKPVRPPHHSKMKPPMPPAQ